MIQQEENSFVWRRYFGPFVHILQIISDFLVVFACYMASYWFYIGPLRGSSPQTFYEFLTLSASVGVLYVFILEKVGLYRREISLLNIKELRGIFRAGLYAAAIILSISFYVRFMTLSRVTLTTAMLITPIFLYVQRFFFYKLHVRFHQKGFSHKRVLIYGAGSIGTHLARRMFESPSLGLLPVGFLDDESSKVGTFVKWSGSGPKNGVEVLGGEEWIKKCPSLNVELVFIALPSATFERNQKLVEQCLSQGIEYAIVPNAYEEFIQHVEMFEIGGIAILRRRSRRVNFIYLFLKRILDFVLSVFAIIVLSPIFLLISILIKLDTPGPVIFKQKRVGLRGKEFSFYKFRSMRVDAPTYAVTPNNSSDPRITKIGKWIRRTSLDELPQFFNVMRGDMSLVGPRPEMPFIVSQYTPLQRFRLEAKPGITGVWQISAVRGEPIHANIEYDLFYLENRSSLLDIAILVKTVLSVIRGIGAI